MENDFPRMAGGNSFLRRASRYIPFAGDIVAALVEAADVEGEPDPYQRMLNAGIIGAGGGLVSAATFGLDTIPQIAQAMGEYAVERENDGYVVPDWPVGTQFSKVAPLINPENYLRILSYGGRHEPTERKLDRALEELPTPEVQPTFYYPF
jgi:hypothetical protein